MKRLRAAKLEQLERLSPIVWASTGTDPGFVFDTTTCRDAFLCFFLIGSPNNLAPKITFDQGDGFSEITALALKSFRCTFYHVSRDRLTDLIRLRFQPCEGPTAFRFIAFRTSNAILVAVLHYLFNLRYQKIALVERDAKGRGNALQAIRSNIARIAKFFADVSKGGGVRVQQGTKDMLPILKLSLSLKAVDVQTRMHERFKDLEAPLISFVSPLYNTPPEYLRDLIDSFVVQRAPYAELILSDDGSDDPATLANVKQAASKPGVHIVLNTVNRGIAAATNAGVAAARGRWVAFIDHDDLFVPGAVAVIAAAIDANPEALFFYTDELIVDDGLKPIGEFCKPAYDSVLLSGVNYINHFSIFRRDRLAALNGLREDREGSQDYDLLLRYLADVPRGAVMHIPFLAYMWRREDGSYSMVHRDRAVANARSALSAAYGANGSLPAVEPALDPTLHRIRFPPPDRAIGVSVVIPNRDSPALIKRIVSDLIDKTDYGPLRIVIVDNGSTDRNVLDFYAELERARDDISIDRVEEPFNFSRMCNRGARLAKGDAVLFLNNDIEVEAGNGDWLSEMVECLAFEATGIVGARLLYPSGKVQHNGVIVGLGNAAGHWFIEAEADEPGPMGRFYVRQTLTAVTGACMLVTTKCLAAVGGFDEEHFAIAYNDIDFCLRARSAGFRTIWTPFASLIHRESASRGSDETGDRNQRFLRETAQLQERHETRTMIDDAYSPFYDRRYPRPIIIVPNDIPDVRSNVFR